MRLALLLCLSFLAALLLFLVSLSLLRPSSVPDDERALFLPEPSTPSDAETIRFVDLAKAAGVSFGHIDGHTAMHYFPEVMGAGVAWIDYDQDGYMDLLLIQGGPFPPDEANPHQNSTSRLYRNQGDGTFVDVTEKVGLLHSGYGQGVAVGDYDNDGYPDLCITSFGKCQLWHNEADPEGGRRFREVTKEAGVALDGWCSSCAFGDIHGKGFLDLFVCRYVNIDLKNYPFCGNKDRDPPLRFTCGPREFAGTQSVLFRNNGNGTFTNVSTVAGLEPQGKGLGVVILDLDGDGRSDIFVGNDQMPNFHYRNLGGGKLKSIGVISGVAVNWQGNPMGSMGVEADDLTGHGRPDLFITTFFHQGWTLFRNNGENYFTDLSPKAGMNKASWDKVGWGTCLLDANLDGNLDIFVANGHIYRNAEEMAERNEDGSPQTFEQNAQLFLGYGKGVFLDVSKQAGDYFLRPHVGRGVAMGDYDNDGAMDIAINHCGGEASLLHNETRTPNHWIRLRLEGSRPNDPGGSNRDAIGARVEVKIGNRKLVRHVKGGGSYLSSHDPRLLIGLGKDDQVDDVEVRWPNAKASSTHFGPLQAGHNYRLVEGRAEAIEDRCPPLRKK
jgi:enediyne biosynthesis protein E4